jgi:hypothetical protein
LLMAREHHKQMTCLHLVSAIKFCNGYILGCVLRT